MKVHVDFERCQSHGQCEFAAPAVFTIGDDGRLTFVESPDESLRPGVEAAQDTCPVQAISVDD